MHRLVLRSKSVAIYVAIVGDVWQVHVIPQAVEAEDPKTQERLMPRLADLVTKLLHVAPADAWRGSVLSLGRV